ncbi:MAG: type II toxin-antitoxin system VapC family toxin [Actinomycetota bacterium]|nr:type II toxin-antitoxin system VapC family toxin [Actinomycetota bacterium]
MIAYFDSSALVKLVVEEVGSDDAAALWDAADAVLSSRVAYAEVRAALAAAQRNHRLTDDQLTEAAQLWDAFWKSLRILELDADLGQRAGELAEEHALSGFDAIHLASVLLLAADDPVVATWDSRLHAAAQTIGFATLPAAMQS